MKMTLLSMVQKILNDMDGDEVNSISDTQEATQVAEIVETVYYQIITSKDWTHLKKIKPLDSVSDSNYPNYLKITEDTSRIDFIMYDRAKVGETQLKYRPVNYLYPDEFILRQNRLNNDNDNVVTITDYDGAKYNIYNDRAPEFYTSFDDEYIVFDAYDSTKESTVQGTNSQAKIYEIPSFSQADGFIADLPAESFAYFLAECTAAASYKLRQELDQKAEQKAARMSAIASQRGRRASKRGRYPDFGRHTGKAGTYNRSSLIDKESYSG